MIRSDHAIVYNRGTHRVKPPAETLVEVMPHMSAMGITRIADVTGLDTIGIPVVMVFRPNARSVSVSQGKGSTLDAAKASALMESIEGYHAEHMDHPVRLGSVHDLSRLVTVVNTNLLPQIQGSSFDRHVPITWIESVDLESNKSIWVPYEMAHTNYTCPSAFGSGHFPASSNGLASGNTMEEAVVHAICEIIERDALALWHQLRSSEIDQSSIDLASIDSEECQQILAKLKEANQNTYVWDITSDIGIPTYSCVVVDKDTQQRHIGVGSGTHLSREIAVLRALHEAVQVRTTYIVGARDDITRHEYTPEGIHTKHLLFGRYINVSTFSASYSRTGDCHSASVLEDKKTLLKQLRKAGMNRALCIDLRKPEFNIAVVRVIVPGMESPHDDDGYVAGPRARRARRSGYA